MGIAKKVQELMDERGVTKYRLAKETGVSYTGIVKILSEQTKNPQIDSLKAIADYFGKPVNYFTEEDTEELPYYKLNKKDEADIAKELQKMMDQLNGDSGLSYMGESLEMDENDRELLRISFENSLRVAKQIAKKKFTPKKYRN